MPDVTPARPHSPATTPLSRVEEWLGDALEEVVDDEGRRDRTVVTGLTLSSQRVQAGDLYAALPGTRTHGATFAGAAVEAGAVAVLTDREGVEASRAWGVPVLVTRGPRTLLGSLGAALHDHPARSMALVAVTGTQGKTTTTRLAEGALQAEGITAAAIGTVGTRIAGEDVVSSLTTPEAPDLHALFALMRERGVRACAMEVSSHALVMGRVDGVVFDVAAFLNLGRDHLDFHTSVEDYFAAKASLFTPERARRALVNVDDPYGRRLRDEATIPTVTFSAQGGEADWRAVGTRMEPTRSRFTVRAPSGDEFPVVVPLTGDFNVANALCAVAMMAEAGLDPAVVAAGIERGGGVPGRLEQVEAGQDFLVVVDYAHKPDAVAAALAALRPLTSGRVILVLGAGGDRDPGKRPLMGEIAGRLADVLVVTDDNPRTEDPAAVRAALLAGAREVPATERAELRECGDRRAAIRLAVGLARAGDTVVVAGKGHETGQEVAGQVHPFDDRAVVREELAAR